MTDFRLVVGLIFFGSIIFWPVYIILFGDHVGLNILILVLVISVVIILICEGGDGVGGGGGGETWEIKKQGKDVYTAKKQK